MHASAVVFEHQTGTVHLVPWKSGGDERRLIEDGVATLDVQSGDGIRVVSDTTETRVETTTDHPLLVGPMQDATVSVYTEFHGDAPAPEGTQLGWSK